MGSQFRFSGLCFLTKIIYDLIGKPLGLKGKDGVFNGPFNHRGGWTEGPRTLIQGSLIFANNERVFSKVMNPFWILMAFGNEDH